jgi:SAM-dependent methyltransferase
VSQEHFAHERVRWLAARLSDLGVQPSSILDYGCGTAAPPSFSDNSTRERWSASTPRASLDVARRAPTRLQFRSTSDLGAAGQFELVYCNGVFHHVDPSGAGCAGFVHRSLSAGGYFALWENNPWNPGTRPSAAHSVRSRREAAVAATPQAARRRIRRARTDFSFSFHACCPYCGRSKPGSRAFPRAPSTWCFAGRGK